MQETLVAEATRTAKVADAGPAQPSQTRRAAHVAREDLAHVVKTAQTAKVAEVAQMVEVAKTAKLADAALTQMARQTSQTEQIADTGPAQTSQTRRTAHVVREDLAQVVEVAQTAKVAEAAQTAKVADAALVQMARRTSQTERVALMAPPVVMAAVAARPTQISGSPLPLPLPDWLTVKAPLEGTITSMQEDLRGFSLHTVCEEADCPNSGECFASGTATFMILGETCTRYCLFCAVNHGKPSTPDPKEPENLAHMAHHLNLKHVVVTSVTRDDLSDGGAAQFIKTVEALQNGCKKDRPSIELLIPDFKASPGSLGKIVEAAPEVINHNIETVPRLHGKICPLANYGLSIQLLAEVKKTNPSIVTKSGIMVGLGERTSEVLEVMYDLRAAGVEVLTIGQYLAPSEKHYPVREYVHPDIFDFYRRKGRELGFTYVASAPLVRSSYMAGKIFRFCRPQSTESL